VFGLREGAFIAGTMLAVALPAVLETGDPRALYRTLGPLYAALFVAAVAWCVFGVPERPIGEAQRPRGGAVSNLMALLRHRPGRALLGSYALASLAGALVSTLILFYVERVLGSASGSRFLVVFFGATLLFVPAWISLSRRIGKRAAWQLSLTIGAIAGGAVFFLGPGDAGLFRVLLAVSGAAYGATLALAPSMQADVIDYDEWASGARREGAFVGGWAIVRKLVMALGAAAPFPILKACGYEISPIPEEARFALRALYALAPCACMLAAAAVLSAYPIDRAMHDRIRAELAARQKGAG
jgi:glycoside/pentoside/hexuronide:cation symporter, GPH family